MICSADLPIAVYSTSLAIHEMVTDRCPEESDWAKRLGSGCSSSASLLLSSPPSRGLTTLALECHCKREWQGFSCGQGNGFGDGQNGLYIIQCEREESRTRQLYFFYFVLLAWFGFVCGFVCWVGFFFHRP